MNFTGKIISVIFTLTLIGICDMPCHAQRPGSRRAKKIAEQEVVKGPQEVKRYKVVGGVLKEISEVELYRLNDPPQMILIRNDSISSRIDSIRAASKRIVSDADSIVIANPSRGFEMDSMRRYAVELNSSADSLSVISEKMMETLRKNSIVILQQSDLLSTESESLQRKAAELKRRAEELEIEGYVPEDVLEGNPSGSDSVVNRLAHDPGVAIPDSVGIQNQYIEQADRILAANDASPMEFRSLAERLLVRADSLITLSGRMLGIVEHEIKADSSEEGNVPELTKRQQKRLDRQLMLADTSFQRYSALFREPLPISRTTAISLVVPGFSQLHNKQAWKIPVIYAVGGTTLYYGLQENHRYRSLKRQYDERIMYGYNQIDRNLTDLDEVQGAMIRSNTRRQLWFGAVAATYMYSLVDGIVSHPSQDNNVKIATTLSTILPGAGQIYNGSYWKAPIVMGAFATMVYMIDWNNRGYNRFKLAYNLLKNPDPYITTNETVDADQALNLRKLYRRNRDLCIIVTGLVYLVNLVDAHVESHMKDYNIDDNLNLNLSPSMTNFSTHTHGSASLPGMSLTLTF